MKGSKGIVASFVGLATACALMLGGCGQNTPASSGSSAANAASSAYTLVTEGKLTVGASADYEPFEYMVDGKYAGFDLDLVSAIAKKLNLEVDIKNVDFDSIVPGVASGTKFDVGISAITVTPDRKKQVDFSDSYYMDDQAICVMQDNAEITAETYQNAMNAEGFKIAVQSGSTAEAFAKENFSKAQIVAFKNATDCFSAVQAGQATALITNRSVASQLVSSSFDNLQVIKQIPTGEEYSLAINKENKKLTEDINKAISELQADGTIDALMEQYHIK